MAAGSSTTTPPSADVSHGDPSTITRPAPDPAAVPRPTTAPVVSSILQIAPPAEASQTNPPPAAALAAEQESSNGSMACFAVAPLIRTSLPLVIIQAASTPNQ